MKIYKFDIILNEEVESITYSTDDINKIAFLDSFLRGYKKRECEILSANVSEFDKKILNSIYDKYNDWSDKINVIIDRNSLALDDLYPEFGTYEYDTCDFIESFLVTVFDIFGFDLCGTLEFGSDFTVIYAEISDVIISDVDKNTLELTKEEAENLISERLFMDVKIK